MSPCFMLSQVDTSIYPIPDFEEIESILIMLWKAKVNIEPLLTDWATMATQESILHFKDLVMEIFEDTPSGELFNPFADKELSERLVQWLDHEATKERFAKGIENIIMNPPKDIEARTLQELSQTYEKITDKA